MILYKYVDLQVGIENIINKNTLKFTGPANFNDPLEISAMHYHGDDDFNKFIKTTYTQNSYGILCLTRNPRNSLMWAHYATGKRLEIDEGIWPDQKNTAHGGLAIGIDVNLAGFNDYDYNVLPAKYGNVIYTATKPTNTYQQSNMDSISLGRTSNYQPQMTEALQRTFLYKPQEWAYEEEVRVVRNIKEIKDGIFTIYPLAIKEVYIGLGHNRPNARKYFFDLISKKLPHAKIFIMELNDSTWQINSREMTQAKL